MKEYPHLPARLTIERRGIPTPVWSWLRCRMRLPYNDGRPFILVLNPSETLDGLILLMEHWRYRDPNS